MEASSPNSPRVPPRVMRVDLNSGVSEMGLWSASDAAVEHVGSAGGSSLAVALLHLETLRAPDSKPAFVVTVGPAVRDGLPTAARATVASRAPLTGAYADGQVGSDLGRRLASVCDGLLLSGHTNLEGAVLHIRADGAAELVGIPELSGGHPTRIAELLEQRFGECASLRVGPSASAGVRFASLIAGTSPPSLVGRGGLGFAFASTGLTALAVSAPRVAALNRGGRQAELDRLLMSSPRLALRGEGGTLELAEARAVRGELTGLGGTRSVSVDEAETWSKRIDASKGTRHGCAGCPTPCGYMFESPGGIKQSARFSVLDALGWNLGLEEPAQALSLLRTCDEWGIDAKEAGAILAAIAQAREDGTLAGELLFGEPERLLRALIEVASGSFEAALHGAQELRRKLGLASIQATGIAERAETNLAVRLGARVACRGAEPMRTYPFLVDGSVRGSRLEGIFAPFRLPSGSTDPLDPCGKGRLVWWHENFAAAVDASGFCAFSAASLLADGTCSLADLARLVAPEYQTSREPGLSWLATGAATLLLVRELNWAWRGAANSLGAEGDDPVLGNPGMVPEYAAWRGLEPNGQPRAEWRGHFDSATLLELGASTEAPTEEAVPARDPVHPISTAAGRVRVRAFGSLGARLGSEPISFNLPCVLSSLVEDLARDVPEAASSLIAAGEILPAVYRDGERLKATDLIYAEDTLDLILVTAGG